MNIAWFINEKKKYYNILPGCISLCDGKEKKKKHSIDTGKFHLDFFKLLRFMFIALNLWFIYEPSLGQLIRSKTAIGAHQNIFEEFQK